jgi:hypothetical protein
MKNDIPSIHPDLWTVPPGPPTPGTETNRAYPPEEPTTPDIIMPAHTPLPDIDMDVTDVDAQRRPITELPPLRLDPDGVLTVPPPSMPPAGKLGKKTRRLPEAPLLPAPKEKAIVPPTTKVKAHSKLNTKPKAKVKRRR